MKTFASKIFILFFVLLFSIVISSFYSYLTFTAETYDSEVYYYFYNDIRYLGLHDFYLKQVLDVGRVDFGFYFIYSLAPDGMSPYSFFLFNYLLISLALIFLYFTIVSLREEGNSYSIRKLIYGSLFFLFLLFFWYPSYMNLLWVWRSYIAVVLFLTSILLFYRNSFAFSVLVFFISISIHISILIYLCLFIASSFLCVVFYRFNRKLKFLFVFSIGLFSGFLVSLFADYFAFMFSGGGVWLGTSNYTAFAVCLYLFAIFVYYYKCCFELAYNNKLYWRLVFFLIYCFGFSFVFFNNHLLLMRFTLLIMIFFVALFFVFPVSKFKRVILFLQLLPGFIFTFYSAFKYVFIF